MLTDHAVFIPRTEPFGEPAAFLVGVEQPFNKLVRKTGFQYRVQRMNSPEGVPEAIVGIQWTVVNFSGKRTIMHHVMIAVKLIYFSRKKIKMVQGGVERLFLIDSGSFYFNSLQRFIPGFLGKLFDFIKAPFANLPFQVNNSLLRRNKR